MLWIVCEKYNTYHSLSGFHVIVCDMLLFVLGFFFIFDLKVQQLSGIDVGQHAQGSSSPAQISDPLKKCCTV